MFLIAFFRNSSNSNSSRLVIWCWRCCYFNRDSTEVTTGFLAVTPVPHLNRPPPGGKTGGRFICNWRDCETKKGRKRSREIWSDGRSGNSRRVFVWSQTTQQQPHPLRNSWCKNISRLGFKWAVHSHQNRMCGYLLSVYGITLNTAVCGQFKTFDTLTGHLLKSPESQTKLHIKNSAS